MLISAQQMLNKAKKNHYAVPHININNLEWAKTALLTAQEQNSPIILGVSKGAATYMSSFKTVAVMVRSIDESLNITVPVALHLDHGTYNSAKACIDAGFTSVMFDGSSLPFEENLAKTKALVTLCAQQGISLEGEVGSIGGDEDSVVGHGEFANPEECEKMAALGIDCLAAGIGNIHGEYPSNWTGLNFDVLAAVQQKTNNIPLVLHGGTGIPDEMVKKAISLGVAKVNVNTECQLVFTAAVRKYIEDQKDLEGKGFDPRKLLAPGTKAIHDLIVKKMALYGSIGQAE